MEYKFTATNQSPWLTELYNQYLPYKTNGFLVELGVGHTIKGIDKTLPENLTEFDTVSSNTGDLLDIGWGGIYVEPVKEYCDEAEIRHKKNLDRLKIINIGASNDESEFELFAGDTFIPHEHHLDGYTWLGRTIQTDITSKILENNNCPKDFDILSIDVEGFEDKVLLGMDFTKHKPTMIIVEINQVSIDTVNSILPNEYDFIKSDGLNGVWVTTKSI